MSLESVALIAILTLFTIVLGTDLFLLITGRSLLEATNLDLLDVSNQLFEVVIWRLGFVLCLLLVGAVVINLTPITRAEGYLLKIGLGSLVVYLVLFAFGAVFLGRSLAEGLGDRNLESIVKSVDASAQLNMPSLNMPLNEAVSDTAGWYKAWLMLLWSRAIAALVSFWSFLHYGMNPKL
ncbi:MAG: hypothetical protein AAGB19_19270 [Cyanobacteria bacterium P01_F01_bin.3]